MANFEYTFVTPTEAMKGKLNELGREGWRLTFATVSGQLVMERELKATTVPRPTS